MELKQNISTFAQYIAWHKLITNKKHHMNYLKRTWSFIQRHKYAITILVFGLIIGVLDDENSLITRMKHRQEISELKTEINHYRMQYEKDSKTLKEFTTSPEVLEKIAREKYLMKKENEDIYVFEEDLNKK